jgi:hypothetical protein
MEGNRKLQYYMYTMSRIANPFLPQSYPALSRKAYLPFNWHHSCDVLIWLKPELVNALKALLKMGLQQGQWREGKGREGKGCLGSMGILGNQLIMTVSLTKQSSGVWYKLLTCTRVGSFVSDRISSISSLERKKKRGKAMRLTSRYADSPFW